MESEQFVMLLTRAQRLREETVDAAASDVPTLDLAILHAFDVEASCLSSHSWVNEEQMNVEIAQAELRAKRDLADYLKKTGLPVSAGVLQLVEATTAQTIRDYARKDHVDVVIVGTHGRIGPEK